MPHSVYPPVDTWLPKSFHPTSYYLVMKNVCIVREGEELLSSPIYNLEGLISAVSIII